MNLRKTELIPMGRGEVYQHLGCSNGTFPISYLGLPLGASNRMMEIYNPVIEKIKREMACWEHIFQREGDLHS